MKVQLRLLLVLCIGMVQVASAKYLPMIKGGENVEPDSLVAMSTVAIGTEARMHCSASIIAEDILLTAAHCIPGPNSRIQEVTTIYFGVETDDPVEIREISEVLPHPGYLENGFDPNNPEDLNDIALVIFEGGLPSGFQVVDVPEEFVFQEGDTGLLAGYGVDNNKVSGTLKQIERVVEVADFGETEVMFTQTDTEGACNGDSGGPAYNVTSSGLELMGVANRVGNHKCGEYVIYAKPQAHWDWIIDSVEELRESVH